MEKVYVIGHKKPDTDSVCAAITCAYLMNHINQNYNYIPRVLGEINNETKFVLEKFNVEEPKYLNDVKTRIRDVTYHKGFRVNEKETIRECYDKMLLEQSSGAPIVDDKRHLVGLVTLKEIAKELIEGNKDHLMTSYDNLLKTLNAEEVLRFDEEIDGDILVASYRSTTFLANIDLKKDDILIVGDRHSIIEYAVNTGLRLLILVGNAVIKDEHLEIAKKNRVNIIRTSYGSFDTAGKINQSAYVSKIIGTYNPITLDEYEYLDTFDELKEKLNYTNYPILNKRNECLGLLRITDLSTKKRTKVILVDHNEESQSVIGLEEAEIVEVIDHHRLGNMSTDIPINFRNMAVGSTCTIIYGLYKQNNILIPREIAGLILSAILSDTLLLKSPTTTVIDIESVNELANYLNVDYESYGLEMFKAGSTIKGKTINEIIYQDFKIFKSGDKNIGIGQIFMPSFDEVGEQLDKYVKELNKIAENNQYAVVALFVTDIINNGSYILYNVKSEHIMADAFDVRNMSEGHFLPEMLSRKKQFIPAILSVLE